MPRIDVHTHFLSLPFIKHLMGRSSYPSTVLEGGVYVVDCAQNWRLPTVPAIAEMDVKLAGADEMGVDISVLSHGIPGPEVLGGSEADDWASRINDDLASIIEQHPDRFMGFGNLGFGDADRSIKEVDRCINQLGFKGIQLFSNIDFRPLDDPAFRPVFQYIAELGVPMHMHPATPMNMRGMENSGLIVPLGFLYDTSLNTIKMIQSGLFDLCPDLNLIVPHVGGIIPYLYGRLDVYHKHTQHFTDMPATEHPMHHYLDRLYIDTVCYHPEALNYCLGLFGPDRILFGTDHPFGDFKLAADIVERADCSPQTRQLLYHTNAARLLGLPTAPTE
jgi:predicted TIM-barrel fold metal-dependent hydrolase